MLSPTDYRFPEGGRVVAAFSFFVSSHRDAIARRSSRGQSPRGLTRLRARLPRRVSKGPRGHRPPLRRGLVRAQAVSRPRRPRRRRRRRHLGIVPARNYT